MNHTATFRSNLSRFTGDARLYKLSPPLSGTEFVVVSAVRRALDTGVPETYIFQSDEDGRVTSWGELPGSFRGDTDHVEALRRAGYSIVNEEDA